jgi:hypothetical protein
MNSFASFARILKWRVCRSAHAQALGSNLETLILIPNSLLPKQSSTNIRKVLPTKKLTDPEFVYTDSNNTNISKTFQNFKQE